jgi:phosphatidate cytidylyltransferase
MKRVLTALLLIPIVYYLVFYGPGLIVRGVLAAAAMLCLHEFFLLSKHRGFPPFFVLGYATGAVFVVMPQLAQPIAFIVLTMLLMMLGLVPPRPIMAVYGATASTLFGLIYVCGPFALGGLLHDASPHWLFLVLLLAWVGDSAAYYVGRAIGKHKLAPSVSPGKTWEGTIASAFFAILAGVVYLHYFEPERVSLVVALLLSLTVNIAGQLGDLAESALKRSASLKDSGTLLPGHGGMLDRMDNFLFAAPVAYLWLLWITWRG